MADFIFLMHNDAHTSPSSGMWETYISALRRRGVFDGGSSVGGGTAFRKDAASGPGNVTARRVYSGPRRNRRRSTRVFVRQSGFRERWNRGNQRVARNLIGRPLSTQSCGDRFRPNADNKFTV